MKKFKTTESLILLTLWITALFTYPLALLNNFSLFLSDYIGLTGLTIVTLLSIYRSKLAFSSLMILLTLGLFNIASFVYFVNLVFTFNISATISPGVQFLSLTLFLILSYKRASKLTEIRINLFGRTEEEISQDCDNIKNNFKKKFIHLTDKEVENHLQNDLVDEARQALLEIQNERKTVL